MKRIFGAVLALVLSIHMAPVDTTSAQSTDQFRITQYDIQYALSRDSEGRSVLKTTENITAIFPESDQNHGLERSLLNEYDGHPTDLTLITVKNADGNEQHTTDKQGGVTVIRIGDPDAYVHGEQKYTIAYEQRDVTRFYKDTGRDEWYWDTNGTDWRVPIESLTISIDIDPSIANAITGSPHCYVGSAGSAGTCQFDPSPSVGKYSLARNNLERNENITVAFGFNEGTFQPYKRSWAETFLMIWGMLQVVAIPVAIAIGVIATILYLRMWNRKSETHTLVTEYIPPKDTSVMVASQVIGLVQGSAFSAQLIDLAVRRFITIVQTKEKSLWKTAEYDIVIAKDLTPLLPEEKEIIEDMFGHLPKEGERLALASLQNNLTYSKRTLDNDRKLTKLLDTTYDIRKKSPEKSKRFYRWAIIIAVIALVLLSIPIVLVAGYVAILGWMLKPLTDKGLAVRRYVLGLDKYVKASEAERLAFLQGPDSAEKIGYAVDANNPGQIVKLYERVLPYAILFGREKEWSKRLGEFYGRTNSSPDWYSGTGSFNAAVFASTISSFSQASASSAGYSSSSGGSSGGGSSGGGGGGGGGGGW